MRQTVSVIIPTYNYGRFIAFAIRSALEQTYSSAEIIVVDDGSTDETEAVVRSFGEKLRYIRQENSGVSAARNHGVSKSSGEFVAFLDADDIWEPTKLEKQLAKFAEDKAIGLVHCGVQDFDSETGEKLETHLLGAEGWVAEDHILFEKPVINVSGSVIMISREAFETVGGFDTRLKNGEDWEFCFRVATKFKVGFVREALVKYRKHGTNAHMNVAEMERSTHIAWEKMFDTDDDSIRRLKRRSYGNLHKVLAGSYLHHGQYYGFARNLVKSLWYRPSYLRYYTGLLANRKKVSE